MVETINGEYGDDRSDSVAFNKLIEAEFPTGYVSESDVAGAGDVVMTSADVRGYPPILGHISLSRASILPSTYTDVPPDNFKG